VFATPLPCRDDFDKTQSSRGAILMLSPLQRVHGCVANMADPAENADDWAEN
jgi:hypothetical protein